MVYLIGVNHSVQYKNSDLAKRFLEFVLSVVRKYNIKVIAEEWNSEADSLNKIEESNLSKLSKKLGLELVQIEAEEKDQKEFGIMTRAEIKRQIIDANPNLKKIDDIELRESHRKSLQKINFKPRELYWVHKISPYLEQDILLVCGNDHIDTFSNLLLEKSIGAAILSRNKWVLLDFPSDFWE